MRIVVNAVAVHGGGGQTFLLNILDALCASEPRHEYWVVLTRRQRPLLPLLPAGVRAIVCDGAPIVPGLRVLWEQLALPRLLRRWQADLLLAAFNMAVLRSPVPVVLVVHSVNPYSALTIEWSPYMSLRLAAIRWLGALSARVARTVVFASETSARIIAPRMRVPPDRVRVVHYGWRAATFGPSELPEALARLGRYILTVGDLLAHKNVEVLLEAMDRLVAHGYPGHLAIVGSLEASPPYARRLLQLRDGRACRDRVHFIGSLPHQALPEVYRRAELFVFPSLEETFGLPLVEAMGAGVPVVVSDWRLARGGEHGRTNAGPEICGPMAEYFDPTEPDSLVAAMRRVLGDPARRDELVRTGPERAAEFSWSRAATALRAICEDARAHP
jgi:glycosyltransferase involved in cell wall biosynthesis